MDKIQCLTFCGSSGQSLLEEGLDTGTELALKLLPKERTGLSVLIQTTQDLRPLSFLDTCHLLMRKHKPMMRQAHYRLAVSQSANTASKIRQGDSGEKICNAQPAHPIHRRILCHTTVLFEKIFCQLGNMYPNQPVLRKSDGATRTATGLLRISIRTIARRSPSVIW